MKSVYMVMHSYEWCDRDEVKFIGVYATKPEAEAAVTRLRLQPGFCDWPDGFDVSECTLGQDSWIEGFCTSVNILIPSITKEGEYHAAVTTWRPGDLYLISFVDENVPASSCAFKLGDLVRCEEREIDGNPNALVAVERV